MRILLPPSEAKSAGGRGASIGSRRRSGELAETQDEVLTCLAHLVGSADVTASADVKASADITASADVKASAKALVLPASVAEAALADNRRVSAAKTKPALLRYAGVVYEGLAADQFDAPTMATAGNCVLIFSGLFGVLRGRDPVPPYRVPAKAKLPGIGVAGTFWRPRLERLLPPMLGSGVIVDLRSSDYAAMWQPEPASRIADRLISVRVLSPRPDGSLGVISFPSKFAKGRLAAGLLARSEPVLGPDDVVETWLNVGGKSGRVVAAKTGVAVELVTFAATAF